MDAKQTVAFLRCLELGLRTAADEFEKLIEPVHPFDDSYETARPPANVDADALMFYTRPQLVTMLKTVDPGFDVSGLTAKVLRERVATLVKQRFEPTTDVATGVVTDGFAPPGVVAEPEFVAAAEKLQVWFEEHMPKREETIRAYYARMGCDGRCARPGGSCPNALICVENLSA